MEIIDHKAEDTEDLCVVVCPCVYLCVGMMCAFHRLACITTLTVRMEAPPRRTG